MASQSQSKKRLITARCFTFSTLVILSSITLTLAFCYAVILISASSIFSHITLLSYSVILPFCSIIHVSLEHLLGVSQPITLSKLNNHLSMLIISAPISCGWFINTIFWTHCEAHDSIRGLCPSELKNSPVPVDTSFSTTKILIGWITTVVYIMHTGLVAAEAMEEYFTIEVPSPKQLAPVPKAQDMAEDKPVEKTYEVSESASGYGKVKY
jgi:hypothetical protein